MKHAIMHMDSLGNIYVGAPQYTMLVFRFSSLCTLRQNEEEGYVTLYVYKSFITAMYISIITILLLQYHKYT